MADKDPRGDKGDITDKMKNPQWRALAAALLIFVFLLVWSQFFAPTGPMQYEITYTQFMEQLDAGNIKSVLIKNLKVSGVFDKEVSITMPQAKKPVAVKNFDTYLPSFQGEGLMAKLEEKKVAINVEPQEKSAFWQIVIGILPWVLIIGIWLYIMKRARDQIQGGAGGLFTFGQSKAKLYDVRRPSVTFKDVAGMENVKTELRETIEFLKDPARFRKLGAKVPKGVLLVGPPGTGKTLLARATAGEAGVPFFSISGSEFIEMFVGVGASRVRDMFQKAKSSQPSIIFMP
jgi:cell division protease FtsH